MDTTGEENKTPDAVPMANGIPTKEGLLTIVGEMANIAKAQILENSQKFTAKR